MSAIPRARTLRTGKARSARPFAGLESAPVGQMLRLTPRALPRAVTWRFILAPLSLVSWFFTAIMMVLVLAGSIVVGVHWNAAAASQLFYVVLLVSVSMSLVFGLIALPSWIRALRLLRYGLIVHGTLVNRLKKRVEFSCPESGCGTELHMELTFQYEIATTRYTVTVDRLPDSSLGRLELGTRVATLIDPRKPASETSPDLDGPSWLELSASGDLRVRPSTALHLLIVPLAFVGQLVATLL